MEPDLEHSSAWFQAYCSYPNQSLQKSSEVLWRPRPHCCPLSHQIGELTGYCTHPNRHQMGWAKRNVDYCPRNVCPVDRRPMLQRIMETDPLQQGQALASALKNKKKMQKRTGGEHLNIPLWSKKGPPRVLIRGLWVRTSMCPAQDQD